MGTRPLPDPSSPEGLNDPDGGASRPWLAWTILILVACLHGVAIYLGLGGWSGLTSSWPIARHDHPLYFHSALVTREFLTQNGTTAGYDPAFMAGYPKSVVFPASSTLPELAVFFFGGARPEIAYKAFVGLAAAAVPWLIALAAGLFGASAAASACAVVIACTYLWTDFPISYLTFGMAPYFLMVPLALVAAALIARYLDRGGFSTWLAAAIVCSMALMAHLTAAMLVVPAAVLAYLVGCLGGRSRSSDGCWTWSRHLGYWLIPAIVLALNAFWWLPGLSLASTKGPSDFAFAHPEPVIERLLKIWTTEAPVQTVLWAGGLLGGWVLSRRRHILGAAWIGLVSAGFFWGYLAGAFRSLDFLQPGRHTYCFYLSLSLSAGVGWDTIRRGYGRIATEAADGNPRRRRVALDALFVTASILIACRLFGPSWYQSLHAQVFAPEPFLSSRPSPRLLWIVKNVKAHLKPGERLLYEESGFELPGVPDPFQGGRYSGLLPWLTGVEVLGGPYLHAALTTNTTQFGEGKLFGQERWDAAFFQNRARLYRPSAILCWSPWARSFCRGHPELVEILEDDGTLLFGRVKGYQGMTIEGHAQVDASPGRLVVRDAKAELDGRVVLRYHFVPQLRARPSCALRPVLMDGDPVPFLELDPTDGSTVIELDPTP